ncbi:PKD domain-containing protein [Methanospirillum lacunae]|nr:PKD domain-containing protein [Methanospirillum lacunae]
MRLGVISIILLCMLAGLASASVAIAGPTTVTRGGVSDGQPNVDGFFNLSISGNDSASVPMHLGLVVIPQTMTGDICDRPPYLINNSIVGDTLVLGDDAKIWPEDYSNPYYFSKVSPNGVDSPSVGPWTVPWNGTHYYGAINTNNTTVMVGTLYPDDGTNEFVSSSLKPGSYTYHLQSDFKQSVPGSDSQDFNVTVTYGAVTAGAYNFTSWSQGSLVPISTIQSGHTVMLQGTNTDTKTTYLWVGGEGLPKCGQFLGALTVEPQPTDNKGAFMNGTWYYQWEAPCTGGNYTVYASSVNSSDVVPRLKNKYALESCSASCSEGGICGLYNCPTCGPTPATISIKVTEPEFNFTVPEIVDRCCCAAFPCGATDPMTSINLTGYTGTPQQPVRVWLFGNSWMGSAPYLVSNFTSGVDSQGTFDLDVRTLFSTNGNHIPFCELDAGEYNLVIQIPGCNSSAIDVGPSYISKDLVGYKAYQALITKLNDRGQALCPVCPKVTDKYVTLKFTIRDICNGGSADFNGTPTSGLVKLPVQFTDLSTFMGTSWSWDFGDNATSNETNPLHVYTTPGNYTVTLKVSNGTITKEQKKFDYIKVSEVPSKYFEPVANFTYSITHDTTGEVQFIDQSFGSTPLTYSWNFGDNSTSTNVSPFHQFFALGIYSVTLTVTDTHGKVSNITQQINVNAVPIYSSPVANFTYVPKNVDPMTIQFIDQSFSSTDLWYLWNFGDGTNSTDKVPAHTYTTAATYNVSLTVTDQYDNASTASQSIQVPVTPGGLPNIDFTADITSGQYPLTVQFLDNTTTTWADSWQWNFGDGAVSSLRSPSHTYTTPGQYTVTLRAANVNGEGNEMTKENYIIVQNHPPVIAATADPMSGNFPLKVEFTANATVNNKTVEQSAPLIKTWIWEFGDSSTTSEQNPTHVYETPGNYNVTVLCQLVDGVSSQIDVGTIKVGPQPYANFYWDYLDKDETCCYLVKFTDTSVGAASWNWDFGDGLTSIEQNPTHRFKEVGSYNVTLTIKDSSSATSIMTKTVQITSGYTTPTPTPTPTPVPGQVIADFTSKATATRTIAFTDVSTGEINGSTTWSWSFGDGTIASIQNPIHLYPTDGQYTVVLTVSNGQFSDSESKTIGVR